MFLEENYEKSFKSCFGFVGRRKSDDRQLCAFSREAYDDTYVYVMTEQSLETTSDVEITESTNGEYISLITSDLNEDNNIDPWVAVNGDQRSP